MLMINIIRLLDRVLKVLILEVNMNLRQIKILLQDNIIQICLQQKLNLKLL